MSTKNSKDKDDGILGDGLAELARKQLRNRQSQLDEILGDTPIAKPAPVKPGVVVPKKDEKKIKQSIELM